MRKRRLCGLDVDRGDFDDDFGFNGFNHVKCLNAFMPIFWVTRNRVPLLLYRLELLRAKPPGVDDCAVDVCDGDDFGVKPVVFAFLDCPLSQNRRYTFTDNAVSHKYNSHR